MSALTIGAPTRPQADVTRDLRIGDSVVGEIRDHGDDRRTGARFHVVIDARRVLGLPEITSHPISNGLPLIQGHGETADEAIVDGVERARGFVRAFAEAIEAVAAAGAKRVPGENAP